MWLSSLVTAGALATYLIPGCVGRGVRLGSESSSATAAGSGAWKSGNLEIWDLWNLEIWGPGNPEILRFGDLETQKFGVQQMEKIKILKIQAFWISRLPDISNLAWVGPGLGLGWARGSAVLGRGGGRRAPQHSTATCLLYTSPSPRDS